MSEPTRQPASRVGGLLAGGGLVVVGAVLLIARYADVDVGEAWPLFVVLPGLALAALGIVVSGRPGSVLTGIGSIIAGVGLILAVFNATGTSEDWAYAWTLIPGALGAGLFVRGMVRREPRLVTLGARLAVAGVILFVVLFVLFEFNSFGALGGIGIPVLLLAAGALLLARTIARR
jgi:hypothetical protein